MKRIITLVLIVFNVYAVQNEEYTYLDCEIKLRVIPLKQEEEPTKFDHLVEYSHPYIPLKKGVSTNWCGYVALSSMVRPLRNVVTGVYGSWIAPSLSPSASAKTYCSIWVGIDGYGSPSVEQIGTAHEWRNGKPYHYAWFEMYPLASCEIVGFPVAPGDTILTSVVYQGNGIFSMTITNETKKVTTTVPTLYTTSNTAERLCAEWIVEAPYLNGTLPLANFNKVIFSQCKATINGIHGPINQSSWAHDILTMQNSAMAPKATATPLGNRGEAFSVQWHHE